MIKYYTRACNFYYGKSSRKKVEKKIALPLGGDKEISFDKIEIFSRNNRKVNSKIINIKKINLLPSAIRRKVKSDIKKIILKRKFLNHKKCILMGIINLTPDSFSDGGKYNSKKKAIKKITQMINFGADIIDVGGESTRPGSKIIPSNVEWQRVKNIIKIFKKKFSGTLLSVDTRKSSIIKNSIKYDADIINDVSCFRFDKNSYTEVKNKNVWKIIHHMQGTPQTMQINPKYNDVILDIYDFFENEILKMKNSRFPDKIILDPGIGFGKKLKHNLIIFRKISIFHSLGFPILIGSSRKRFISQISKTFDTKDRLGGTLASVLFSLSQGVKIFRTHNISDIKQGILVFEKLLNKR
tara:strand:+ start:428 stop:1489 length:1062 start_codon:yes stop_codon:yes gene_type:complete